MKLSLKQVGSGSGSFSQSDIDWTVRLWGDPCAGVCRASGISTSLGLLSLELGKSSWVSLLLLSSNGGTSKSFVSDFSESLFYFRRFCCKVLQVTGMTFFTISNVSSLPGFITGVSNLGPLDYSNSFESETLGG
jgi:hypothetical protein